MRLSAPLGHPRLPQLWVSTVARHSDSVMLNWSCCQKSYTGSSEHQVSGCEPRHDKVWKKRRKREERQEGRKQSREEERGHSFIYYDASCSVGLMCGEQTVFYVLILQAVCVGWG